MNRINQEPKPQWWVATITLLDGAEVKMWNCLPDQNMAIMSFLFALANHEGQLSQKAQKAIALPFKSFACERSDEPPSDLVAAQTVPPVPSN